MVGREAADFVLQNGLMRTPRLYILLLALVASHAPAQAPESASVVERIESAVRAEMDRQGIPGLSLALARAGEVQYANGFGVSDVENQVPARAVTVYRLASISKPITAVAAMQLSEEGKLNLDAPVQTYVRAFPQKAWPVTTRQLLGHLGGVRHYRGDEVNSTRHYDSLNAALSMFRDDVLVHEPGTKYLYTTYGYNLVGAVVEGASERRFMDYLREKVFRPARMLTIRADSVHEIIPNRAQGYRRLPNGELRNSNLADTSNKIPGGGLCSTVEDLARFAMAVQGGRLLRRDTLELMWTPQTTVGGERTNYGLGWAISSYRGRREVSHGGGQPRVSTYLYTLPDQGCAVALMSNLEDAKLQPLARRIADLMLN